MKKNDDNEEFSFDRDISEINSNKKIKIKKQNKKSIEKKIEKKEEEKENKKKKKNKN